MQKSMSAAVLLLTIVREAVSFALGVEAPQRSLTEEKLLYCASEIAKADVATGGKLGKLAGSGGPWMECAVAIGGVLAGVAKETIDELKAKRQQGDRPGIPAAPAPDLVIVK